MKRNTKTLLCVLCAVAAVLCVVFACFMLTKKQSGTTASSAASGASVSTYGKVSDFDYSSFDYSEGLDDNGHWTGIRALDYVTLPDNVSALPLSKADIEPTEAEIQTQIDTLLNRYATTQNITGRAAQSGDTVNIDYSGAVDGVAFTGGTATGYDLTLGSHTFIDGFEDQIIPADSRLFRRRTFLHLRHPQGARQHILRRFHRRAGNFRQLHADARIAHLAIGYEIVDNLLDRVDRNGQADALDGRIAIIAVVGKLHARHAHQFAREVEKPAAAVARVDGRIGLDHVRRGRRTSASGRL